MADRTELEDAIYDTAKRTREQMDETLARLSLAMRQMQREEDGAARIVPEQKTLEQDLHELGAALYDMHTDWEALMQNWEDLMETIGAEREEGEDE